MQIVTTNSETIETEISIYITNSVSDNTCSTESNDDDSVVTEYQCVEIGIYWVILAAAVRKMCSENVPQICRRTPLPKCDFNKFM